MGSRRDAGTPVRASSHDTALSSGFFTIDVEDWYQSLEENPNRWSAFEDRITAPTLRLLDLLRRSGASATFFVLGFIAERHPELVAGILREGHEVGTHGHFHRPVHTLTPEAFRADLRRSLRALHEAGAKDVVSFRAPYFSLPRAGAWARHILADEGIVIDSSVFPLGNASYGVSRGPNAPGRWGPIWEFPLTLPVVLGRRLPISGGFYSRFFPLRWTIGGTRAVLNSGLHPMFYVHPWELDPHQPRYQGPRFRTARHYHRLHRTDEIVSKTLRVCEWKPLRTALATQASTS